VAAMILEKKSLDILRNALDKLEQGFKDLPALDEKLETDRLTAVLQEVALRMQNNYPYQHPFYAGQMLKPPHPVARLAYMLAIWINPNNHALDGGRASSEMEKEAVAEIARMFGWDTFLGHLTGGGTLANLEALWIAGKLYPDKMIVASDQAHSTHQRITEVLKIPFRQILSDSHARMDLDHLEDALKSGNVGTVVATLGTTGTGSVDPLPGILELQRKYTFRIHVDAAYGGYFTLADNLQTEARTAFDALPGVDSIVVDPHKHGLQPYGAGCVLFKDPAVGKYYKHDSPYTYFSSQDLHLGEISLECSRAGASAVALWATQKMLPLTRGGEFARGLERGRTAARELYNRLKKDPRFHTIFEPELDIVVWGPSHSKTEVVSEKSRRFFEQAAAENLHLALFQLPLRMWDKNDSQPVSGSEKITVLRSCLMKPEHLDWIDEIWKIIDRTA
jgi:glutamate/tyrosine decarboxylase-like PLP-dependent enzyme